MPGWSWILRCARVNRESTGEAIFYVKEGFAPLLFLFIQFLLQLSIIWQLILILTKKQVKLVKMKTIKSFKILGTFGYFCCVGQDKYFFLVLPTFVGLCLYWCLKNAIKNNWLFANCEHFRHLHFQQHFVYTQNLIHSSRSWQHKGDIENYWLKSKNINQVPISFCQSNISDYFITSPFQIDFILIIQRMNKKLFLCFVQRSLSTGHAHWGKCKCWRGISDVHFGAAANSARKEVFSLYLQLIKKKTTGRSLFIGKVPENR